MKHSKEEREDKIRLHCSALAEVISAIRPIYARVKPSQQALIETMIGAAIWYVPKPTNAWTGKISRKALERFHPESNVSSCKLSEEHVYPRKIAAQRLLRNSQLTPEEMERIFREEYGRLHYITPEENKAVIRFQKAEVFTTPDAVYQQAGIDLISVDPSDLKAIKKRSRDIIDKYIKKDG
ncbi:MAG: hypothetical protein O2999_14560 [Nitrospirae bacterium]|nr:hypothetical protein [Nitrospirota bacterium]